MNDTSKTQTGWIRCGACDVELEASFNREPRRPCPSCGSIARSFGITCEPGQIEITGGPLEAELNPANQVRDWRQRWEAIQANADKITQPSGEPLNGDTIVRRRSELHAFYVQCYHLKDALRADQPNGVTANAIENAITASPVLAVVADLCNLEKHAVPGSQYPPRSGSWPTVGNVSGRTCAGGWKIVLTIRHGQATLDGLDVVERAVVAWRQILAGFGLI